jgi:hypothetical protein
MAKHVNHHFFSAWNPEMAYVLGFWFADGWMSQPDKDCHITFVTKDLAHLQLIQRTMQSEQAIYARSDGCSSLTMGSKQLWHDLFNLGGLPAKSLIVDMPYIPQDVVRHFIRGFIDGDGSLYWETVPRKRPMLSILGGISFLERLTLIIDEETGVGMARVWGYAHRTPTIAYTGIKAKVLAKWLYTSGALMLERKAAIAREFITWEPSTRGWKSLAVMTPKMHLILAL